MSDRERQAGAGNRNADRVSHGEELYSVTHSKFQIPNS